MRKGPSTPRRRARAGSRRRSLGRLGAVGARRSRRARKGDDAGQSVPRDLHRPRRRSHRRRRPAARGRASATTSRCTASRPRCRCCGGASSRTRAATARSAFDPDKLLAVDEVRTWGASTEAKELGKQAARAARLEAARAARGRGDAGGARRRRSEGRRKDVKERLRFAAERAAFAEAEKRLVCEGLLDPAKHKTGSYDTAMRTAMLAVSAEAGGDGPGRHQARDAGGAGAAAAGERPARRSAASSPSAPCTPPAPSRTAASPTTIARAARSAARPTSAPTARATGSPIWRRRRWTAVLLRAGDRHADDAVAFFRRHTARRLRLAQGGGAPAARCPSITGRRWTSRPRSIAATSGTTSRSTPRGSACRSRASASRPSRST